jgi:hypothetical protein
MSIFENQLKTLIATLEAVEEKNSFDMTIWHHDEGGISLGCGYVACICGHQAVAKESEDFENISSYNYMDRAQGIASCLDDSCHDVFHNSQLASSIYEGLDVDRMLSARRSHLFTDTQLNHPHLTKEHPTIKQAISFIKLALKKVEAAK